MDDGERLGGSFTFNGTSITVRRLGYGAMRLSGPRVWGAPADRAAAVAVLRAAVEAGVDHIDTSDFYGPHVTNQLIREALAPYREGLTIATKVGFRRDAVGAWLPAQSAAELHAAVEDNLRNLGLEQLDLVNLRLADDEPHAVEAPLRVLAGMQRDGLIRHIGLSNVTPEQLDYGCALAEIVCVQNEYNLAQRRDDAFIDELAAAGIAYVPYFPLGGFTPLQSATLASVARALDATPMQVALAWLLHRSPNILPIPGTSSPAHLRENVAAARLRLTVPQLVALDGLAGDGRAPAPQPHG